MNGLRPDILAHAMQLSDEEWERLEAELEAEPTEKAAGDGGSFFVTKDAAGEPRWVLVSSSAYVDRDGEIVTEQALIKAVERMDATKEYGDLRWWHTPVVLGRADFAAVHAHHLIESGTFVSKEIAARVMAAAESLGASIGFRHPVTEPQAGAYSDITIKERSLLPRGKESNYFTALAVKGGGGMEISAEKKAGLLNLLGEEQAGQVLSVLTENAKAADDAGVTRKEAGLLSRLGAWLLGQPEVAQTAKEAGEDAAAEEEAPDAEAKTEAAEAGAGAGADAPDAEAEEGKAAKADADDVDPDEMLVTAGELKAALKALRDELGGKTKEADALKAEVETVKARAEKAETAAATAKAEADKANQALALLTADLPRGVAGIFRASQAESTVTDKAATEAKKAAQVNDPLVSWVDSKFGA